MSGEREPLRLRLKAQDRLLVLICLPFSPLSQSWGLSDTSLVLSYMSLLHGTTSLLVVAAS